MDGAGTVKIGIKIGDPDQMRTVNVGKLDGPCQCLALSSTPFPRCNTHIFRYTFYRPQGTWHLRTRQSAHGGRDKHLKLALPGSHSGQGESLKNRSTASLGYCPFSTAKGFHTNLSGVWSAKWSCRVCGVTSGSFLCPAEVRFHCRRRGPLGYLLQRRLHANGTTTENPSRGGCGMWPFLLLHHKLPMVLPFLGVAGVDDGASTIKEILPPTTSKEQPWKDDDERNGGKSRKPGRHYRHFRATRRRLVL